MPSDTPPEHSPLMTTISSGFFEESIRVQLFSKPQHTQASNTSSEPLEKEKLLASSTERIMLESVTSAMPIHRRLEMASRNTASAMSDVATISKLFSREAFAAFVRARPSISRIGAATSSSTIASVKGSSRRVSGCSRSAAPAARCTAPTAAMPSPAPRYSSAAMSVEGRRESRSLETGAFSA